MASATSSVDPTAPENLEALCATINAARRNALGELQRQFSLVGTASPVTWVHSAVRPGLPSWPSDPAGIQVIGVNEHRSIVCSQGLCAPFSPTHPVVQRQSPEKRSTFWDSNGIRCEVFGVCDEPDPSVVRPGHWLCRIISSGADYAAARMTAFWGMLSYEQSNQGSICVDMFVAPGLFADEEQARRFVHRSPTGPADAMCISVLFVANHGGAGCGMPERFTVPNCDMRCPHVWLYSAQLLHSDEAAYVYQHKEAGRKELVEKLRAAGALGVSSLSRAPMVDGSSKTVSVNKMKPSAPARR